MSPNAIAYIYKRYMKDRVSLRITFRLALAPSLVKTLVLPTLSLARIAKLEMTSILKAPIFGMML